MKHPRHSVLGLVSILLTIIVFIAGCAPSVRIPVTRPAEINLIGVKKIAVGDIGGNAGRSVTELLTTRLFESGHFEVVDRENIERIMKEHQLNMLGVVDKDTAAQVGKLTGASALIFGTSSVKYNQEKSVGDYQRDREGKLYRTFYKTGKAKVNTTLRVVDLTSGKILAIKSFSEEKTKKDWERNEWPADIDRDALVSIAVNRTIDAFMKMIAPYTDYVSVNFEKGTTPEGKSGINFAKIGQWEDALEQFKLASEKNPGYAGAWYNLGIAYEYNYMFEDAKKALKKANSIKPSEKYVKEIANVNKLKAEQEKLKKQMARASE